MTYKEWHRKDLYKTYVDIHTSDTKRRERERERGINKREYEIQKALS